MRYGTNSRAARVTMPPAFLLLMDGNPQAFLTVLAHEAGHRLGPKMAFTAYGHDLKPAYGPMLQCLSRPESIRLQPGQEDETVADMVAAEITARLISELPLPERLGSLAQAIEPFCLFEEQAAQSFSLPLDHKHPGSALRVSGIFGGNEALRGALACERKSRTFSTCSWPDPTQDRASGANR